MVVNGYSQYQENQVLTASPGKLLLMAYDGAIRFCRIGLEKMRAEEYAEQSVYINKALAIICELMATLKEDVSPGLVANLRSLYIYTIERLGIANMNQDEAALTEVIGILTKLRETWAEADKMLQQQNSGMEVAA